MRYLALAACLLVLCLAPSGPRAQSDALREGVERRDTLRAEGRLKEAMIEARDLVRLSEIEFGDDHPVTAGHIRAYAILHLDLRRDDEAEPLLRRALAIREADLEWNDPDLGQSLFDLGEFTFKRDQFREAESLFKSALTNAEAVGPDDPGVLGSLNYLARIYVSHFRFEEAEALIGRALAIAERAYGPEDPKVAESIYVHGRLWARRGRMDEAEDDFLRALEMQGKSFGPDHPDIADGLSVIATYYREWHREKEAAVLMERVVEIREKVFGRDHPDVRESLMTLAEIYRDLGRFEKATELIGRARAPRR